MLRYTYTAKRLVYLESKPEEKSHEFLRVSYSPSALKICQLKLRLQKLAAWISDV